MAIQYHRTTSDFEHIVNEVQLEMPEAAYDLVQLNVQRSIIEFCRESHYWVEDVGPLKVVAATDTYDVPVSQYQEAVVIHSIIATLDENVIELHRSQDENVKYRFFQNSSVDFVITENEELAGYSMSIKASVAPRLVSGEVRVSEAVLNDYHDAIANGARSRLQKIPRKPWSDLQSASLNGQMAAEDARSARRALARGFTRAPDGAVKKARTFL